MASKTLLKIRTHATAIRKSETWQLLILPVLGAEHLNVRMLSLERFIQSLVYCGCLYFPNHKHSSALRSSKATLSDRQSAAQLIAFSPSGENATLTFIFFLPRSIEGLFNMCYLHDFRIVKYFFPPPISFQCYWHTFHYSISGWHLQANLQCFRQILYSQHTPLLYSSQLCLFAPTWILIISMAELVAELYRNY